MTLRGSHTNTVNTPVVQAPFAKSKLQYEGCGGNEHTVSVQKGNIVMFLKTFKLAITRHQKHKKQQIKFPKTPKQTKQKQNIFFQDKYYILFKTLHCQQWL